MAQSPDATRVICHSRSRSPHDRHQSSRHPSLPRREAACRTTPLSYAQRKVWEKHIKYGCKRESDVRRGMVNGERSGEKIGGAQHREEAMATTGFLRQYFWQKPKLWNRRRFTAIDATLPFVSSFSSLPPLSGFLHPTAAHLALLHPSCSPHRSDPA